MRGGSVAGQRKAPHLVLGWAGLGWAAERAGLQRIMRRWHNSGRTQPSQGSTAASAAMPRPARLSLHHLLSAPGPSPPARCPARWSGAQPAGGMTRGCAPPPRGQSAVQGRRESKQRAGWTPAQATGRRAAGRLSSSSARTRTPCQHARQNQHAPQHKPPRAHLLLALRRLCRRRRLLGLTQRKLQVALLRQQAPRVLRRRQAAAQVSGKRAASSIQAGPARPRRQPAHE